MLTVSQVSLILSACDALTGRPVPLLPLLVALAAGTEAPDEISLANHVRNAEQADPVINRLRYLLTTLDASTDEWTANTQHNTEKRRTHIYGLLGLGLGLRSAFDERLPFAPVERPILISEEFQRWYTEDIRRSQDFYWRHYKSFLLRRHGVDGPEIVQKLDENTNLILERLAKPQRADAYRAKGLVVGYVQSGKTANFTGVIAKAIDAGYRLVVVLSGLTDLLRNQTQRRLDMELVGKEQIRGSEEIDSGFDYAEDPDWDQFMTFGGSPMDMGGVRILRLTGAGTGGEFHSLKQGIQSLEIEKRIRHLPIYDPANLPFAGVRFLVIKKNPRIIEKLIHDMRRIGLSLFIDVPALVIDDESDQASVNTINPNKAGDKQRTATNEQIRTLLSILPRAQYVGYTATPFANVFISPKDAEDLFPRDFILSLPRPHDYIGPEYFHDLDDVFDTEDQTVANSKERAFIRDVPHPLDGSNDRLNEAVDAFVLSGAIKLFRHRNGIAVNTKHHTMLVHSSRLQADQSDAAERLNRIWRNAGYDGGKGIERLRRIFESDFSQVSKSRGAGLPFPGSLDELFGDIGETIRRIDDHEGPVYIVNGSDEANDPNFDLRSVWKIVVGGAKLSRGYTIEGLTISYFRRQSNTQDTLLQMGRWFGFRRGYHDLLRLYLGRSEVIDKKGTTLDLYSAFEAICRDEDDFRNQLEIYSLPPDESEPLRPQDIPPIVFNRHPQLRPAAANKMYAAKLMVAHFGGRWIERLGLADKDIEHNAELFHDLIGRHSVQRSTLLARIGGRNEAAMDALWAVVPHAEMLTLLTSFCWASSDEIGPELKYLSGNDPAVDDWAILLPQIANPKNTWLSLACVERTRVPTSLGWRFLSMTDPKHRLIAECLVGVKDDPVLNESAQRISASRRGVLLLYPTKPKDDLLRSSTPFMGLAILPPPNPRYVPTQFTVS